MQADQDNAAAAELVSMVALQVLARRVRRGRPTVPMVVNATEPAWGEARPVVRERVMVTFAEECVRAGVRPVALLPDNPERAPRELVQAAELAYGVLGLADEEMRAAAVPLSSASCDPDGRTARFARAMVADRVEPERSKLTAVVLLAVAAQGATGAQRIV